eukprot:gene363-208_t
MLFIYDYRHLMGKEAMVQSEARKMGFECPASAFELTFALAADVAATRATGSGVGVAEQRVEHQSRILQAITFLLTSHAALNRSEAKEPFLYFVMGHVFVQFFSRAGMFSVQLIDSNDGLMENFVRQCRSNAFGSLAFDKAVPGVLLRLSFCGPSEVYGIGAQSTSDRRLELHHVGAGVVSAKLREDGLLESCFISLSPQPLMDDAYRIVGRVSDGLDALKKISLAPCTGNDRLECPVVVDSVRIHHAATVTLEGTALANKVIWNGRRTKKSVFLRFIMLSYETTLLLQSVDLFAFPNDSLCPSLFGLYYLQLEIHLFLYFFYILSHTMSTTTCDAEAFLFGMLGAAASLGLANIGAAYGTAKAGVAVAQLGMVQPSRVMRGIVPVVMAGILGIYGLIVSVIVSNNIKNTGYPLFSGFMHLGAGLAAGFASLGAGYAIGVVGDICCYAYAKTEKIFVPMILMLIFAEALGLYGLIIALLMNNKATAAHGHCTNQLYDLKNKAGFARFHFCCILMIELMILISLSFFTFAFLRKPRSDAEELHDGRLVIAGNTFNNFKERLQDDEVKAICIAATGSSDIMTIELPYNSLTSTGVEHLATSYRAGAFDSISELDLTSNSIGSAGAIALADALRNNHCLMRLTLSGNPLGDGSGPAIESMLRENKCIAKLDLAQCDLTMKDLVYIFGALEENTSLVSLDVGRPLLINPDDVNYVVHHLSLALRRNTALCELGLSHCNLVDSNLQQLIPAFCSAGITRLSLRGNRLSQDGGEMLARLLERKQDFIALDVSNNRIRDVGASAIAKSICTHPHLQGLYLENNTIGEKGLTTLASAIDSSRSLVALSLWGNDFSGDAIPAFYRIKDRLDVLNALTLGCIWLMGSLQCTMHRKIIITIQRRVLTGYRQMQHLLNSSMKSDIELADYLADQNQLYAYYLSRCGTYHVHRPNRFVLELLEEDIPAHYKRLKYESKQRQLPDWMALEEIEGDTEEQKERRICMIPLSKRRLFRITGTGTLGEEIHLGARGMMAVLDLVAQLPLVEELDLSNLSSWYIDDAFPFHSVRCGSCGAFLRRIDIRGQPIGTLAANEILELCRANPRINRVLFTREGVDYRLCAQLDKVLQQNDGKEIGPAALPECVPECITSLPRIDRKTLREQQILRAMLESDDHFTGLLTEDETQQLVHTRTMSTAEVITRCNGRGLRGDGEHLFVLKSGRIRAFTDLVGFTLQRGDYFGEKYDEVLFSTCLFQEELRGVIYAIPLTYCRKIVDCWEDRLTDFYPLISKSPFFQPLATWCRIRVCTCSVRHTFEPGAIVVPAADFTAAMWVVQDGVFYALAGSEEEIDRTGRFDPYPFYSSEVFGGESLVARKKCSSVNIIAGKERGSYSAICISGSAVRILTDQLGQVLLSLVRPYSTHEDVGAEALKLDADDIKNTDLKYFRLFSQLSRYLLTHIFSHISSHKICDTQRTNKLPPLKNKQHLVSSTRVRMKGIIVFRICELVQHVHSLCEFCITLLPFRQCIKCVEYYKIAKQPYTTQGAKCLRLFPISQRFYSLVFHTDRPRANLFVVVVVVQWNTTGLLENFEDINAKATPISSLNNKRTQTYYIKTASQKDASDHRVKSYDLLASMSAPTPKMLFNYLRQLKCATATRGTKKINLKEKFFPLSGSSDTSLRPKAVMVWLHCWSPFNVQLAPGTKNAFTAESTIQLHSRKILLSERHLCYVL